MTAASVAFGDARMLSMTGLEGGAATVSVVASGASGLVVWGSIGGIACGAVAVVTLVLSVIAGNAKRRQNEQNAVEQRRVAAVERQRQHEDDIRAAEERGRASLAGELAELRDIRTRYLNLIERDR